MTILLLANTEVKESVSVNENGHLLQPNTYTELAHLWAEVLDRRLVLRRLWKALSESLKSYHEPYAAGTFNLFSELNSGFNSK